MTSNATSDFASDGQSLGGASPSLLMRDLAGDRSVNLAGEPSPVAGRTAPAAKPADDSANHFAAAEPRADAIEFRVTCPDSPTRRLRLCGTRYSFGCGDGCSIRLSDDGLLPLHAVLIRETDRVLVRAHSVPIEINDDRVAEGALRLGDRLRLGSYLFELVGSHLPALPDATIRGPSEMGRASEGGQSGVLDDSDSPSMPDEPLESAEFDRRPHRFGPDIDSPRASDSPRDDRQAADATREQLEEDRRRLEAELQEKIGELEEAIRLTRFETDRLRDEHQKANEQFREATDELCLLRESNQDLVTRLEQTRSDLRQATGELERRPTHDAFEELRRQLAEVRRPAEPKPDVDAVAAALHEKSEAAVSQGWQTPRSHAVNEDPPPTHLEQPTRLEQPTHLEQPAGIVGQGDEAAFGWNRRGDEETDPDTAGEPKSQGSSQSFPGPGDDPSDSVGMTDPGDLPKQNGDRQADLQEHGSDLARYDYERSAEAPQDEDEESSLARQLIRELQDETADQRSEEDAGLRRPDGPTEGDPSAAVGESQPLRSAADFTASRVPAEATEWMAGALPADPRAAGLATDSAGGWPESPAVGWDEEPVAAADDPRHSPGQDRETGETTVHAPADVEASQSEEAEDDSIEAYMNRLLQRMQGTTDPIPPAPPDPEPRSDSRKTGSVADPQAADAGLPERTDGLTHDDFETSSIPRSLAPEKGETLSSLRQVANASAHSAIVRSVRVQIRDLLFKTALKATAGLVTLATGFAAWNWMHGGLRVVGVIASLVVTGFFLVEAFGHFRETRRRVSALAAAGQAVSRDEAAPEA